MNSPTYAALGVLLVAAVCSLRSLRRRQRTELYDDADAVLLNLRLPQSRWFNMGYWTAGTAADDFPSAAAELCRRVAQAARLKAHERVCVRSCSSSSLRCFLRPQAITKGLLLDERQFSVDAAAACSSRRSAMARAILLCSLLASSSRAAMSGTRRWRVNTS